MLLYPGANRSEIAKVLTGYNIKPIHISNTLDIQEQISLFLGAKKLEGF